MHHSKNLMVIVLLVQVLITTAQYDDDYDSSAATLGICLISPAVAFKLGVVRGEKENENDGAAAFSTRECALRAFLCGGVGNTDCINCLQLDTTACTTINGCTAAVGSCSFSCP
ncbi:uncharacterized protein LOC132560851 [Ylistrum balloti]|uniref:uncharacterized protein LOC132560851 n=1 Tax=Ylistrum balloti TaxID=509963 RepID=UPI002905D46C|nr:uncharacterized protein LOC132560851 [Ylistrum balloti]